jgi:hypothetical protein
LAYSYKSIGKTDKSIELEKESLEIRKALYKDNPERWAEDYTISLNNLAFSFIKIKDFSNASELLKTKYEVCLSVYGEEDKRSLSVLEELDYVKGLQ